MPSNAVYADLTPVNGVAMQHQIAAFLRDLIMRGVLAPDDRLPNVRELARIWHTSQYTVQSGLTPLVEAGLIVRRPRLGTFVADQPRRLELAGIYCDHVPADATDAFANLVTTAVFQRLALSGANIQAWFDHRPEFRRTTPLPALQEAVTHRRVQAIAVTCANKESLPWLQRLGLPMACITHQEIRGGVCVDDACMAKLAVERLASHGCRRLGIISHMPTAGMAAPGGPFADVVLYRSLWEQAQELGLEVRPEWFRCATDFPASMEKFGYESFLRLQQLPERPDGLLLFPDQLARGVFHALQECAVKVPEELRLVVHRNREIDLFSPVPVDWVCVSIDALAQGVLAQLDRQIRGRESSRTMIQPELL